MATHPSVPSRVTSGHCSGGGLSPVGGSRWPCEDGGPLAPCPSPKASAMCCGSPSPRKPLPVPGAQRDRSKWGLWTEQGRGPLATRGHTPGGARRTGCPHKLPPSEAALWDRRRAPRVGSSRHRRGWTAGRRQGRGLLSPAALPSPSRQVFVVELLGRRLLILLGFSICFTACCVLTAALALQVRRGGTEEDRARPPPPSPTARFPPIFQWHQAASPVGGGARRHPPERGRAAGPWGPRFPTAPGPGRLRSAGRHSIVLCPQDSVSWMPYLSIACVISYVIGHALGPSMYPELLPRLRCPPSCTIGSSSPERPGEAQLPLSPGSGQSVLRAKKW